MNDKVKRKQDINWFVLLPIILLLLFILSAYTGSRIRPVRSANSDTLIIAQASDPLFLNPVLASDSVSMYINSFIFNTLVMYDENLDIVPSLAKSWEISKDGKKITFNLQQGILWHDGTEFTAEDCVFTFQKVLDPATITFNAGLFKVDEKPVTFSAPDKYTLLVELPEPFAPFLNNLTLIGIVPKHLLEKEDFNLSDFSRNPIGTGPFRFSEWKASDSITIEKNRGYFAGEPRISKIMFKIIPSSEGRRIALLTDQVDMAGLSSEDVFLLKGKFPPHLEIYNWEDFRYTYFSMDLTNEKFRDLKVRQAINHAVDTKTITGASLYGTGNPIYGPIPRSSWAYAGDRELFPYDPDKARELLEEAGWKMIDKYRYKDGKKFSFNLSFRTGSRSSESAALYIQSYLRDIGIEVKLHQLDLGALIKSLYPGEYDSVVFDWVEPFDPDVFTEWHSSQMGDVGMNFMSYENKEVDRLLEKARTTFDREERKKLYTECQNIIFADAPYIFLWNAEAFYGVNKRVKGLAKPSPAGLLLHPEKAFLE